MATEMKEAVLAYCERECPDTYKPHCLYYGRFVTVRRKLTWNLEPYFEVLVDNTVHTLNHFFKAWDFMYSALGLAELDALEAERERIQPVLECIKEVQAMYAACTQSSEISGLYNLAESIGKLGMAKDTYEKGEQP